MPSGASLYADDEEHFREAIRDRFFSEYIELVRDSFVVDWEETTLVKLSEITQTEPTEE
jgi:hypothetical protein